MSGTTAQRQSKVRVLGVIVGVSLGLLVFVALRGRAYSGAARSSQNLTPIVGALLVLSGTKNLFFRAAFPERSSAAEPERLRHSVVNAAVVLGGVAQLLGEPLGIWLSGIALTLLILATLGVPRRIFRTSASLRT